MKGGERKSEAALKKREDLQPQKSEVQRYSSTADNIIPYTRVNNSSTSFLDTLGRGEGCIHHTRPGVSAGAGEMEM